eukprot:GEMP01018240.1.p1 GENE.GEMP01018240.1~~GEMP01018240.1.p1  ORF type:complete len:778 (+),score=160.87 GEMP01018240.1:65-2398(+)
MATSPIGPTDLDQILQIQDEPGAPGRFMASFREHNDTLDIRGLGDHPIKCDKCNRWVDTLVWQIDGSSFSEECVDCRETTSSDEQLFVLCFISFILKKHCSLAWLRRLKKEEWVAKTLGPTCHQALMCLLCEKTLLVVLRNGNKADVALELAEAYEWAPDTSRITLRHIMNEAEDKTGTWSLFLESLGKGESAILAVAQELTSPERTEYVNLLFCTTSSKFVKRIPDFPAWQALSVMLPNHQQLKRTVEILKLMQGKPREIVTMREPMIHFLQWPVMLYSDLIIIQLREPLPWIEYLFIRHVVVSACLFLLKFVAKPNNRWRTEEAVTLIKTIADTVPLLTDALQCGVPTMLSDAIDSGDVDQMHAAIRCATLLESSGISQHRADMCKIAVYDALFLSQGASKQMHDGTFKNEDYTPCWQSSTTTHAPVAASDMDDINSWMDLPPATHDALENAHRVNPTDQRVVVCMPGEPSRVFNLSSGEVRDEANNSVVLRIRRHLKPPQMPPHWPALIYWVAHHLGMQTLRESSLGKLQRLFCECRHEHCVGDLTVVEAIHVGNLPLWNAYVMEKNAMRTRHASQSLSVHPLSQPVPACLQNLHDCDTSLNETYVFHGTSKDAATTIMKMGFDIRVCEGMFGAGLYSSPQCCKALQYAQCDVDGLYNIFVARVCLGDPYETTKTMAGLRRPPGRDSAVPHAAYSYQRDYRKHPSSMNPCDSVVYMTPVSRPNDVNDDQSASVSSQKRPTIGLGLDHNEFIVYDKRQAYPEYLCRVRRERYSGN